MADHYCHRSEEFGELKQTVKLLKQKVMGNGREGLDITVPKLNQSVLRLTEEVLPDLRTAISGFTTFMTESKAEDRAEEKVKLARERIKDKRKIRNRWILTSILTLFAILTTWLIATR